jgi:hypothetical protein
MNFEDAVTQYVADYIDMLERDYQWKFSLEMLPIEMNFNNESWLKKNIFLRKALHDKWNISTPEQRLKIISWYIAKWGGIKRNSQEKLAFYASAKPERLIEEKTAGIASWSKALSIVDPMRYAIFDARVSSSLNSIQIIKKVFNPRYFPDLPSRNKTIISATSIAKSTVKKRWKSASKEIFYSEYNSLLGNIATEIGSGVTLQIVEMVLFSRAEQLAKEWCK